MRVREDVFLGRGQVSHVARARVQAAEVVSPVEAFPQRRAFRAQAQGGFPIDVAGQEVVDGLLANLRVVREEPGWSALNMIRNVIESSGNGFLMRSAEPLSLFYRL